jgi:fructose-1,6-bisphosphatase/inositol monophosphatase family enzyme
MFGELDVDAALSFACETADHARSITRRYFRQPLEVQRKADFSPVTQADRECELMIRQRIKQAYPTHGILGEEHGREGIENDFVWVLDPIDGTKSFISGNPLFGTMICLLHRWQPVLSIVDIPMLDERWTAVSSRAPPANARPCPKRSSTRPQLIPLIPRGEARSTPYRKLQDSGGSAVTAILMACWRPALSTSSLAHPLNPMTSCPSVLSLKAPVGS